MDFSNNQNAFAQIDLFEEDFTESAVSTLTPVASAVTRISAVIPVRQEDPVVRAQRRIRSIMLEGHPIICAFSSGKDSSCLVSLVLDVARQMISEGIMPPPLTTVHSNTGIEQPEVTRLATEEMRRMRAYAKEHGIELTVRVGKPTLSSTWQVKTIGGRGIPSFPDGQGSCSQDLKIAPNTRLLKIAMAELGHRPGLKAPVVMTGVRMTESAARDVRIAKRGEVAEGIWENDHGQLRASPILDWETDDVWTYLGLAAAGEYSAYSKFEKVMELYAAAGGSSCVIVADMKTAGKTTGCGARTGCYLCVRVGSDRSMEQMIEGDPARYGYMKPLSALRDFVAHSQYDWSLRQYIGRTIDEDGFIKIQADTYSPEMIRNLLGYALTAQIESGVTIIDHQMLVAIDARWSLYGLHAPFSALKLFFEVEDGLRMYPPTIERVPKTPLPVLGKLYVGNSWSEINGPMYGLRDAVREMHAESCGLEMKVLKNGLLVIDDESPDGIDVDPESAMDFVEFFGREMVNSHCRNDHHDWATGYLTYLQYGTVAISKGKSKQIDETLRRTRWRQEHNLHGQQDLDSLRARIASQASTLELASSVNAASALEPVSGAVRASSPKRRP